MDGDGNINSEALETACEAQADMEAANQKWFQNLGPGLEREKARKRYFELEVRALMRRNENVLKVAPELRPLEDESVLLLDQAHRTPIGEESLRAYDRADKKVRELDTNIESLLKRLCSPPSV